MPRARRARCGAPRGCAQTSRHDSAIVRALIVDLGAPQQRLHAVRQRRQRRAHHVGFDDVVAVAPGAIPNGRRQGSLAGAPPSGAPMLMLDAREQVRQRQFGRPVSSPQGRQESGEDVGGEVIGVGVVAAQGPGEAPRRAGVTLVQTSEGFDVAFISNAGQQDRVRVDLHAHLALRQRLPSLARLPLPMPPSRPPPRPWQRPGRPVGSRRHEASPTAPKADPAAADLVERGRLIVQRAGACRSVLAGPTPLSQIARSL